MGVVGDEYDALQELYYGQFLKILVKSPKSEERAKAKNYYKQQVYRLLRKAKANIEAALTRHAAAVGVCRAVITSSSSAGNAL